MLENRPALAHCDTVCQCRIHDGEIDARQQTDKMWGHEQNMCQRLQIHDRSMAVSAREQECAAEERRSEQARSTTNARLTLQSSDALSRPQDCGTRRPP